MLLEVAVCISVYMIFLWLEMAPPLMEGWKVGSPGTLRRIALDWTPKLDKAMPYIVAMAIVLPSMHQQQQRLGKQQQGVSAGCGRQQAARREVADADGEERERDPRRDA